jgi:peptide/nickel transport system substrate-binding protein
VNSRGGRFVAATLVVPLLLAGCGGSGGGGAPAASTLAPGNGGVVRWGIDLSNNAAGAIAFDPTVGQAPAAEEAWQLPLYDSLLRTSSIGSLVPGLASSASIVNSETVAIRLRPGIRFSDGTPLDAQAVKLGILRNERAPNHGQFRAQLYDISSIDVTSLDSLVVHLSQPVAAAFYPLLSSPETYIVSPKAAADPSLNLNQTPVGAGPFLLRQYVPDQKIVLVKSPTYWDAAAIKVREIEITNVPTGPQDVDALESSQVDVVSVPLNDLPTVRSGGFDVQEVTPVGSMVWLAVCKASSPFDDVRVRQALSYDIDRQAIDQAVLQGKSQPQWSLWPQGSPLAPASLQNSYAYNPRKARQLLEEAGFGSGLTTSVLVLPGIPVLQQVAQILQQEWKQIGVTLNIVQSSDFVTDLYERHEAPLGLISEIPSGPTGLDMLNRIFVPGAIGDLCNYNNPSLDAIVSQLNAVTPGTAQSTALWDQAQQMIVGQALAIFVDSLPDIEVSDAKVGGNAMLPSTFYPLLNYWKIFVK